MADPTHLSLPSKSFGHHALFEIQKIAIIGVLHSYYQEWMFSGPFCIQVVKTFLCISFASIAYMDALFISSHPSLISAVFLQIKED